MKNMPEIQESSAILSEDGKYRYLLSRVWDRDLPSVCFVMLNPSTADADLDDPTIRRCFALAVRWGYGSLNVVNIFAYRSPDPKELLAAVDPVGEENDVHLAKAISSAHRTVVAWGINCKNSARRSTVLAMINEPYCLGMTKDGEPRHPLYVPGDTVPSVFKDWIVITED